MKTSEFIAIEKQLLPHFPGLKIAGSMMVAEPMDWSLRAILFDRSADKKHFTVWTMSMLLCIPTNVADLSWGKRIRIDGIRDGWHSDLPDLIPTLIDALQTYAVPFLESVSTAEGFLEFLQPKVRTMRCLETTGFTLARIGRTDDAVAVFEELLGRVAEVGWQVDVQKQARFLRDLLVHDPEGARTKLDAWQTETIENLKLQKINRTV